MAEAVGLAIGIFALTGSFKDCVDLFSYISAARSFTRDYQILATKLDVERTLLLQWAERTKLLVANAYDERLDQPSIRQAVAAVLASIKILLSEGTKLESRYGLRNVSQQELPVTECALSGSRFSAFMDQYSRLTVALGGRRESPSSRRQIKWAIYDRDKFETLIDNISQLVGKLYALVPTRGDEAMKLSQTDIQPLHPENLEIVLSATRGRNLALADVAETAWVAHCEKQILNKIWFRKMDDRRSAIDEQHPETLEWAFEDTGR